MAKLRIVNPAVVYENSLRIIDIYTSLRVYPIGLVND